MDKYVCVYSNKKREKSEKRLTGDMDVYLCAEYISQYQGRYS